MEVDGEGFQSVNAARSQINLSLIGQILLFSFFLDTSDLCTSYQWGR